MTHIVTSTVSSFLKERQNDNMSLLVAFSGGPDSLALLHALLELKQKVALAHVDHGWRPESSEEAKEIAAMSERLGLPLHVKTLAPGSMKGNLEAACREERLNFFAELCRKHGYDAVLLGHHADDQAETVLKRLFEGAGISNLGGICRESNFKEIKLWRPLLRLTKKQILSWLQEKGLQGFHDKTNDDPKYMRARMRSKGIPLLAEMFGKEISGNLCYLGDDSMEISQYLDERIGGFLSSIVEGPWGLLMDLSHNMPNSSIEIKHLIRCFCERAAMPLSRAALLQTFEHMSCGDANKQVTAQGMKTLYVDRRRLFILTNPLPKHQENWKVTMAPYKGEPAPAATDWRSLWHGHGEVVLPEGEYRVAMPEASWCYQDKGALDKWWTARKVPSFLRYTAPVILMGDVVVHEFLTGNSLSTLGFSCSSYRLRSCEAVKK